MIRLYLKNNEIKEFKESDLKLVQKLVFLDLTLNPLISWPKFPLGCRIRILILNECYLNSKIDLTNLPNLVELHMQSNLIANENVPDPRGCSDLASLDLVDNEISELPDYYACLPQSLTIFLAGNKLNRQCVKKISREVSNWIGPSILIGQDRVTF